MSSSAQPTQQSGIFDMGDELDDAGAPQVASSPGGFGTIGLSAEVQAISKTKPYYLFEISHEVAKKTGGIYTVISSKAHVTVQEWGDRYAMVGIYDPQSAAVEFEELQPTKMSLKLVEALQQKYGITVHFGRWLIDGYPRCFLLDPGSSRHNLGQWRFELQGSIANENDQEANDAILFGYQTALFLKEVVALVPSRPIIAHFHEWLGGVGLIVLKRWNVKVATVFTTHATLLGRYMAAGGMDLYESLRVGINADAEAGRRCIYNRHWLEVGAARGADIFTTVSEITGFEASRTLGREPEIVTPNGLNIQRFIAMHQFQNLHKQFKEKITDFVRGHFCGYCNFDLDNTIYMFTAGRAEYRNKGVDLMIEALAELNFLLKRDNSPITVVAFIIMPGKTNNFNVESIKAQSVRRQIQETCEQMGHLVSERVFERIMKGEIPDVTKLFTEDDMVAIKRRVQVVNQSNRCPPIVTHNVSNDAEDEVLCHLRACKLINMKDDKVKVIYHPEFLSVTSPLIPLDYKDFVRGCHIGIFPSYYEPWGYTPAECCLSGIPSVTSNLTGFANYMARRLPNSEECGIYIIDRRNHGFGEAKEQLANSLWRFCKQTRRQRIEQRNKTEQLSELLDWQVMYQHYVKARSMALQKVYGATLPMPPFLRDEFSVLNKQY
eukprot:TRINITY_DN1724_c0_g1_i10.p1 TRINITY_DN1724_c0_g1~~TRINITY_DN1724_c0_g1_i10.p1  ORF type:complete len:663 (+),score=195.26 TRINITY_DN1724_c0_g1_i10:169-2157(+)